MFAFRHTLPLTSDKRTNRYKTRKGEKNLAECHCRRSQLKSSLPRKDRVWKWPEREKINMWSCKDEYDVNKMKMTRKRNAVQRRNASTSSHLCFQFLLAPQFSQKEKWFLSSLIVIQGTFQVFDTIVVTSVCTYHNAHKKDKWLVWLWIVRWGTFQVYICIYIYIYIERERENL